MDLNFSSDELAFQQEVREFLAEAWDADLESQVSSRATMRDGMVPRTL